MEKPVYFDHIEAHVSDIQKYCNFLVKLFQGGKHKKINDNGTSMYVSPDDLAIEIKKRASDVLPIESGICMPCIRLENPEDHICNTLGLKIDKSFPLPEGSVYFFTDHENIVWHAKSYIHKDQFIEF